MSAFACVYRKPDSSVYVQESDGKISIMEVPELLIEVIVTGIMAETIARTTSNSCKDINIFVEEEAGQFFEEVLHIRPTCYSMLHNMYT